MRYLIIADVHGNLEAFQTVLEDAEKRGGFEEIWNLGDIVGYGPNPCECMELLGQYKSVSVAGNHDWAVTKKLDTSDFNPSAASAVRWTERQLSSDQIKQLRGLPLRVEVEDFTLVHGSPRGPIWEYMFSPEIARANLDLLRTNTCLMGHTHTPIVFEYLYATKLCVTHYFPADAFVKLDNRRLFINPGSVGQPRDGNPLAGYAIYDTTDDTVYHYRVAYDIETTQEKMKRHTLPARLIERLSHGW